VSQMRRLALYSHSSPMWTRSCCRALGREAGNQEPIFVSRTCCSPIKGRQLHRFLWTHLHALIPNMAPPSSLFIESGREPTRWASFALHRFIFPSLPRPNKLTFNSPLPFSSLPDGTEPDPNLSPLCPLRYSTRDRPPPIPPFPPLLAQLARAPRRDDGRSPSLAHIPHRIRPTLTREASHQARLCLSGSTLGEEAAEWSRVESWRRRRRGCGRG
jgi:hypothetical protein